MSELLTIRNNATEKEYPVTAEEWAQMGKQGRAKLFTVVRRTPTQSVRPAVMRPIVPAPVPPEVQQIENKKKGGSAATAKPKAEQNG